MPIQKIPIEKLHFDYRSDFRRSEQGGTVIHTRNDNRIPFKAVRSQEKEPS